MPRQQAVLLFMHGTWMSPEIYGLQLNRLAAWGMLVLAPCGVDGIRGYAQFSGGEEHESAYQVRVMLIDGIVCLGL